MTTEHTPSPWVEDGLRVAHAPEIRSDTLGIRSPNAICKFDYPNRLVSGTTVAGSTANWRRHAPDYAGSVCARD